MTRLFFTLIAAAWTGMFLAAAAHAGVLGDTLQQTQGALVAAAATFLAGCILGAASKVANRLAAHARAKGEAQRNLFDIAAIEAKKRIEALNRGQLAEFLGDWIDTNAPRIFDEVGLADPARKADEMLTETFEAFVRRNPDLADALAIDPKSMVEKLAGAINRKAGSYLAKQARAVAQV